MATIDEVIFSSNLVILEMIYGKITTDEVILEIIHSQKALSGSFDSLER